MLHVVEPVLPQKHVANAHEAHGIVRLGEILIDRGPAGANREQHGGQRPADKPGCVAVIIALKLHAARRSPKSKST